MAEEKIDLQDAPNPYDFPVNAMLELTDEQFEAWLRRGEELSLPYPWCHGNPTRRDCIEAGYCRKDPSCGE